MNIEQAFEWFAEFGNVHFKAFELRAEAGRLALDDLERKADEACYHAIRVKGRHFKEARKAHAAVMSWRRMAERQRDVTANIVRFGDATYSR